MAASPVNKWQRHVTRHEVESQKGSASKHSRYTYDQSLMMGMPTTDPKDQYEKLKKKIQGPS
eukprot:CAMPEP_0113885874 /NCGR_PEP_ID=MMETSP0780_2-20120614/11191_1 /TAXON_ID=652834 /ORGANISM="Palpitomonas bilix" /LENGTH=61 /DNA_ID=CAMNT_0000873925 /DNA_START=34 /DNA_END=216 /DNA_ORIENTATION=+ /assembly_acc=CAM_ASM_000599